MVLGSTTLDCNTWFFQKIFHSVKKLCQWASNEITAWKTSIWLVSYYLAARLINHIIWFVWLSANRCNYWNGLPFEPHKVPFEQNIVKWVGFGQNRMRTNNIISEDWRPFYGTNIFKILVPDSTRKADIIEFICLS